MNMIITTNMLQTLAIPVTPAIRSAIMQHPYVIVGEIFAVGCLVYGGVMLFQAIRHAVGTPAPENAEMPETATPLRQRLIQDQENQADPEGAMVQEGGVAQTV